MTTPNYNPNTPTAALPYSDWQVQFVQNFAQLNNAFSANHVPLTSASNAGNHTYVQFPEQSANPQTGASEFSIFSKDIATQTDQLYFVYPGNSPVVQFTNYQIYSILPSDVQTFYFTFLPGGLLVYFGTFLIKGGTVPSNTIFLKPPVAKHVISTQFTLSGTTADNAPGVFVSTPDGNGIIHSVIANPSLVLPFPKAVFYKKLLSY